MNEQKKVTVGITLNESELAQFRDASHVDINSAAVLAMARKGLEASREGVGER